MISLSEKILMKKKKPEKCTRYDIELHYEMREQMDRVEDRIREELEQRIGREFVQKHIKNIYRESGNTVTVVVEMQLTYADLWLKYKEFARYQEVIRNRFNFLAYDAAMPMVIRYKIGRSISFKEVAVLISLMKFCPAQNMSRYRALEFGLKELANGLEKKTVTVAVRNNLVKSWLHIIIGAIEEARYDRDIAAETILLGPTYQVADEALENKNLTLAIALIRQDGNTRFVEGWIKDSIINGDDYTVTFENPHTWKAWRELLDIWSSFEAATQ